MYTGDLQQLEHKSHPPREGHMANPKYLSYDPYENYMLCVGADTRQGTGR